MDGSDIAPEKKSMPNEPSSPKRSINPSNLVILLGAPSAMGTVLALFGGFHWSAELFTHFRVQYFCALLLCVLYLLVVRRFRWAAVYGVAVMVNLLVVLPIFFGKSPDAGRTADLRVMLMNVNRQTGDSVRVLEAVKRFDADLVLLEEVDEAWLERLAGLREEYPYRIEQPQPDNFGIALFSRTPLQDAQVAYFGDSGAASTVARLVYGTRTISFIGTHPVPPGSAEFSRMRDTQMEAIADAVVEMSKPVIVLGDLNMTPWSPVFQHFLDRTGLSNSGKGWGLQTTWPANLIPFRVPLDHCLHSEGVQVVGREIGPNVGSDHYPLIVDFVFDESVDE
jgi:endonuclease/exonuclease/phosphatase (EEP) superfamily protein YafD